MDYHVHTVPWDLLPEFAVYDQTFANREEALKNGTAKLKEMMLAKVGDKDTTNYNQKIIAATLNEIDKLEISLLQLTLF